MATHNRRDRVLGSLERLHALAEGPPVIVVDNASTDGTAEAVRARHPGTTVLRLGRNLGAAGRNVGVRHARTRFVAFADDDSWWGPGALGRAAALLDGHPALAVIAARTLVGADERLDPTSIELAGSELDHRHSDSPGVAVLGFLACAAVVRRRPFLDAGGFSARYGVGGEEELLAIDLASRGWDLAYVDEVVAHHHPSRGDGRTRRSVVQTRNAIWTAWLRLPGRMALQRTARLLDARDPASRIALFEAVRGLPWVLRERRVVRSEVVHALRTLERRGARSA